MTAWADSWGTSWGESWGAEAAGATVQVPTAGTTVTAFAPSVSASAIVETVRLGGGQAIEIDVGMGRTVMSAMPPKISANDFTKQNLEALLLLAA
jgi:hypothetical protein